MFRQIADSRHVDESSTRVLATERARTIASYLTERGLSRDRIQTGRISAVPPGDNGAVSAKLQLATGGPK